MKVFQMNSTVQNGIRGAKGLAPSICVTRGIRWIVSAALSLVFAGVAVAQSNELPAKYTLDRCLRIGLERSVRTMNAKRDSIIARAQIRQARSTALPQLSVSGVYKRLDELQTVDFGDETIEMGNLNNYSVDIEAKQLIYSGGKVGAAIDAAKLARDYAVFGELDASSGLEKEIRTMFYDLLLAKAAVQVSEESMAQIQSLVGQTEAKRKSGTASDFEAMTAQVKLANQKPALSAARNALAVGMDGFKRLINVEEADFDIDGELVCEPFDISFDKACKLAMEARPGLRQLGIAVDLKEQDMIAAKSGYYPSLYLYGLYNGANSYSFVSYANELEWHWSAGAVVSWNLWDSGLTSGTVLEKKMEHEKRRADYEDARKAVVTELRQAFLDMQRASETVTAGRDNIALAQKALDIAKTRYDSGMATYLEFTDANVALRTAQLSLFSALRDHMNAVARLRYAVGDGK